MTNRPSDLSTILADVRRRWTLRSLLRAWTGGVLAAAVITLAGFGAVSLVAGDGLPLVATAALVVILALLTLGYALWPYRRQPSDRQIARFIEERATDLDDVVVTAVDAGQRPDFSGRMRELLSADAARALAALDLDLVLSRQSIRQAGLRAAAGSLVLAIAVAMFAPAFSRASDVALAYAFPARLTLDVVPGAAKVRAGQPLTISARVGGVAAGVVPSVTVVVGKESRSLRMTSGADGAFTLTIDKVTAPFTYSVSAAAAKSADYDVSVVRPPRVERIDVHYEFPRGLGLDPRTDEDSGDIYGPAGTKVRLAVTADKPIASAALVLTDGSRLPLDAAAKALGGGLTIEEDGSYRIALTDTDGLESPGDTEYFIRTMDDRPPDVRILRPASDKHVTPLEEVAIEARADDDYGIASFDLVFQTAKGAEKVVPIKGQRGGLTASGLHTLFMEELGVQPGDFVTYFARARDVARGRRSTEARSDIFFLEVKPFEEEFVAAQSSAMGQGAGMQGDTGLEALAEAQKQIIVATWKLDARARRARDASSQQDVKAVAKAQSDLRTKAEQTIAQVSRTTGDPRRRRGLPGAAPNEDPLGRAVEAMGRAVGELDQTSTTKALPHEMEALNQLLKAIAEARRREVTRSQQAGGSGGANRAEADLSSLFDQELRKRQSTNYETPNSTEERQDEKSDDLLERIRELARRQDALNRQQRDVAQNRDKLEEAELKRQLERLTREQNDLRRQAEQLAQRMQQQNGQRSQNGESSSQSGQSGQSGAQNSEQLRQISEEMRNAETGMRRQDPQQASASGSRASERLRELERQMQTAKPDDRRRALGDLQLETRQIADEQRRLSNEAERTAKGEPGDDARRRLAGEQERLAGRADRLQEQVKRMSRGGQGSPDERKATEDAARELERQKLAERMRQSADSLRQSSARSEQGEPAPDTTRQVARQGDEVARALDRIADRLGAAGGSQDRDSRRLSDQLSKTQELRDKVTNLERSLEELKRQNAQGQGTDQNGNPRGPQQALPQQGSNGEQQASKQGPQQAQGSQGGQQQGQQASSAGQDGAAGQQGGSAGGNGGRVQQLQREVNDSMRDAARLADEIRRENPGMQSPNPDEGWWRSFSAPGTEAFKQDFARWESLKRNLLVALEDVETKVSTEIRARENKERLNAGGHAAVSDAYRDLVDKYYRSLATPRKK